MPRLLRVGSLVALTMALVAAPSASAVEVNPYERGPAPTVASIEASRGYFATAQLTVSRSSVTGFGGGTIYYPTDTSQGTFGAMAVVPGYTGTQSSVAWIGPRLASQGFVVFVIDTISIYDFPPSRGTQLLAALDYLTGQSSVRARIDSTRLAVAGHSMGGGGSLEAANKRPTLQAAIPLAPWHTTKNWSNVRVPTFIIAGQNDTVASPANHAKPFYDSLTSAPDKAYMELAGASHYFPNSPNTTMAKYMISWSKRFIDNDVRYEQFLCPRPTDSTILRYLDTCPHS